MCYNRPAVEYAVKPGAAPVGPKSAESASSQLAPHAEQSAAAPHEDASRYCPACSQPLASRRCKRVCAVCVYIMYGADYYGYALAGPAPGCRWNRDGRGENNMALKMTNREV